MMNKLLIFGTGLALALASCGENTTSETPVAESTDKPMVEETPPAAAAPKSMLDEDPRWTDYTTTASGMKYKIHRKGTGKKLEQMDQVQMHYRGFLSDGTPFDASYDRNQPLPLVLGRTGLIAGWTEGLEYLTVGDSATLVIPSKLGYGERGFDPVIPPNSDLVFEVVPVFAHPSDQEWPVEGIEPKDVEGMLCYTLSEGTGLPAQPGDVVFIHYSGYTQDGKQFDSSVLKGQPFGVKAGPEGQVIKGWQIATLNMRKGERSKFVIPADMAYGKQGRPPVIPQDATLTFDMEMLEIQRK